MSYKRIDMIMIIGLVLSTAMVFMPVVLMSATITPVLLTGMWVGAGVVGVSTMVLCGYMERRIQH